MVNWFRNEDIPFQKCSSDCCIILLWYIMPTKSFLYLVYLLCISKFWERIIDRDEVCVYCWYISWQVSKLNISSSFRILEHLKSTWALQLYLAWLTVCTACFCRTILCGYFCVFPHKMRPQVRSGRISTSYSKDKTCDEILYFSEFR